MYERAHRFEESQLESDADKALATGDTVAAEAYLASLISKGPHPDMLHHAALKRVTLPLYELAYDREENRDVRVYDDANDVFGYVGHLLQRELHNYSPRYNHEVGHITESVFLGIHLRELVTEQTAAVMLPASAQLDKRGIDFHLSPVGTESVADGPSYQVKTSATPEDQDRYAASQTILISMSDIDPHATDPRHPDSLARTLLRELHMPYLEGTQSVDETYSNADRERLDRAVQWVERKTKLKQSDRRGRSISRTSLQQTISRSGQAA